MNVSQAVAQRRSCRAFLDQPVDPDLVREVLIKAARAASGGNVQPWRLYLLHGDRMADFKAQMAERSAKGMVDAPEYPVYPSPMKEPYRSQRFGVGETMYAQLGIPRDDKPARLEWFANNFQFFGAPVAAFLFVDRDMGAAQWSDLGGYLATVMLLLEEAGLGSCPQEAWCTQHKFVSEFVSAPAEEMLFAGLAIGLPDTAHPVNGFMSERAEPEVWLQDA
ncbi:MAG: nitroreductase [Rhodobacteraceae bacterium]|nr:nitroreductase [Paracoccaceae bacterium]